jgi:undecaprenyl diphosphate synthase
MHKSSTLAVPDAPEVPRHVAIIMDGNGRWAKHRHLPRFAGHQRGVEAVRAAVKCCVDRGIGYLTLFAFSSENWRRPAEEVALLMELFTGALTKEVVKMHRNGVRLRVVGDLSRFDARIQTLIEEAERMTAGNTRLTLTIAANYGGRWDVLQALSRLAKDRPLVSEGPIAESDLAPYLSMSYAPEPDLFIRTGGEHRISNFLLWQLAYTELYFTDALWPDFGPELLDEAITWYRGRERRFGRTSEQVEASGRRHKGEDAEPPAGAPRHPRVNA